jgi:uncharacterized protein YdhG (YjbR/CyaY superfamily)
MAKQATPGSIDAYLAGLAPEARKVMEELRALVRATAPGVSERISYDIPTFDLDGRPLLYLAGWQKHVALYPVTRGVAEAFGDEIEPYRSGKGSLKFLLSRPIPTELIRRIVAFRVEEAAGNAG